MIEKATNQTVRDRDVAGRLIVVKRPVVVSIGVAGTRAVKHNVGAASRQAGDWRVPHDAHRVDCRLCAGHHVADCNVVVVVGADQARRRLSGRVRDARQRRLEEGRGPRLSGRSRDARGWQKNRTARYGGLDRGGLDREKAFSILKTMLRATASPAARTTGTGTHYTPDRGKSLPPCHRSTVRP
jgi:hypothetical protein